MKNILFVSYYYPPAGGAGVQRTAKYVKYLPDFGWQTEILTVRKHHYHLYDESFLMDIPDNTSVHRTPGLRIPSRIPWRIRKAIARWLLVVDEQIGWYPFALTTGNRLLSSRKFDAVYSTSPPYTCHLIARSIANTAELPWIADFRDPWIGNFANTFPTKFHQALAARSERSVVHSARRIVVVSEPMRDALLSRHRDLAPAKVAVIRNGYDPPDFKAVTAFDYPIGCLTIVYTGSFYSQGRTPRVFFSALKSAITNNRIPHDQIQVYLVGNIGRAAHVMISEMQLMGIVHETGYVSHSESIAYLLGADVLLLVIGSGAGSEHVLTGKIFEYIAARKPILALAPNGAAADLVQSVNAGFVVDPQDEAGVCNLLVLLYENWKRKELSINPDENIINCLDRRVLTGHLANLLNETTDSII